MHYLIIILQSLNILLFGHSYGVDCTEYLPSLAVEAGINDLHIGRFNKGNCSLEEHYNYYLGDTTSKYFECLPGEVSYKHVPRSVRQAVSEQRWDYVIFQNSLENEGRYDTAQPYIDSLVSFVRSTQRDKFGREPVICWNMFWPISKLHEDGHNPTSRYRLGFYGNSSVKMWEAYMQTAMKLTSEAGIDMIIPTGTAVMLFRASRMNVPQARELTVDGYHMSEGGGRYLTACVLFEKILSPVYHKSVVGNSFRVDKSPVPVTDDKTARSLQLMAADAVKKTFVKAGR